MLTRLTIRDPYSRRAQLQQLVCRSTLTQFVATGITACSLFAFNSAATGDDEMQLVAPTNSIPTTSVSQSEWKPREPVSEPESASATGQETSAADESTKSPTAIQAIPASGPLDRFRSTLKGFKKPSKSGGQTKLGSPKAKLPTPPSDTVAEQNPTPPSNWQGRTASSQPYVKPESADVVPDFAPVADDGNWVARDAVNQSAPLRDPNSGASKAQKPAQARVGDLPAKETPTKTPDESDSKKTRRLTPADSSKDSTPKVSPSVTSKSTTRSATLGEPQTSQATSPKATPSAGVRKSAGSIAASKKDPSDKDLLETLTAPERSTSGKVNTRITKSAKKTFEPQKQAELSSTTRSTEKPDSPKQSSADLKDNRPKKAAAPTSSSTSASSSAPVSVGDLKADESPVELDYTGRPANPVVPSRSASSMRRGIERTLKYFYDRPEIAPARSNWGMMHAMMVYGTETKVQVGRKRYSTIAWIAGNNNCRGQRLLTHDADGIIAKSGAGLQGHQGQFLAVLGMCNVPLDYPLHAGKVQYSVGDLLEAEKRACKAGEELTFTLIALSHYIDTDSAWIAEDGTRWDFERLIAEELKQPIVGAACGGTHRLMGYAHALRKRRAEGKPIDGQWKRAEIYTRDFVRYAYSLQNRDGSMSTKWFEGRADNGDVDRKIQTTGHIVEWLLTLTPNDQLQDPRLVRAVNFLYRSIGSELDREWSIGPKGHALRSLAMYHQRVFQAGSPWVTNGRRTAASSSQSRRYR